jgi:transcriptional/translational regulatory protein YebC/TACO1
LKYGGSLGETGSVSNFAFRYKGVLHFPLPERLESFEEAVLASDAEDYSENGDEIRVVCDFKKLTAVSSAMKGAGFPPESSGLEYLPNTEVEVGEFDKAFKVYRLVNDLREDEDIETVWHNAEISDEMVEKIEEALEASRFRT